MSAHPASAPAPAPALPLPPAPALPPVLALAPAPVPRFRRLSLVVILFVLLLLRLVLRLLHPALLSAPLLPSRWRAIDSAGVAQAYFWEQEGDCQPGTTTCPSGSRPLPCTAASGAAGFICSSVEREAEGFDPALSEDDIEGEQPS